MTLFTAGYAYAMYKLYLNSLKAVGAKPGLNAAIYGTSFLIGTSFVCSCAGSSVVTEMAVNRDLRTMSIRTGLLNSAVHHIDLKDVRPVSVKGGLGFSAPTAYGGRTKYFLPSYERMETAGYVVTHNQLLHDLLTGNADAVAKYKFKQ